MEEVRIQKYLSQCGLLSRRAAEEAVVEGRVTVNGSTASIGQKICSGRDTVCFDGREVRPSGDEHTYLLLHKPAGYVTTLSDERGRPCVEELVRSAGKRVYPVGRLDLMSEGLLLLTDDGDLTYRLTHPRHEIPKYYEVTVLGAVSPEQLSLLRSPMELEGYRIRPVVCEVLSQTSKKTVLLMTLYEGRNRQIRNMCRAAGLKIHRLKRTALGELSLGDLPKGSYRHLTSKEVAYLKGQCDHV